MTNYKVLHRGENSYITYKQKDMLQVDQRSMGLFDAVSLQGFMKPSWTVANEMTFIAPMCITLKRYLTKNCDINRVFNICMRTINATNEIMKNQLFMPNVLFDTRYVLVREMTEELYFVYEPYSKMNPNIDPVSFLLSVINMAKIKDKEQREILGQLQMFLMRQGSLEGLDGFISQVRQNSNPMVMSNNDFRQMPVQNQNFAIPGNAIQESQVHVDMTQVPMHKPVEMAVEGMEEEGTTLLNSEPETTLLQREFKAYLIHKKDNEKIQLLNQQCTIGKSADNYVCVQNNSAVSRHHAMISNQNGIYVISDVGSKNGTLVNKKMLQPNVPEAIQNGDEIVFADEEYVFVVEN